MRYITYALIAVGVILLIFPFGMIFCNNGGDKISAHEIRGFLWLGLYCLVIITFGVLRMYNATVVNSTMINRLNQEIKKLITGLTETERESKANAQKIQTAHTNLSNTMNNLKNGLGTLGTKIEQFRNTNNNAQAKK